MSATAAPLFRPAVSQAAAALMTLRTRIAAQHAAGAPGVATCGLATDLFDRIVLDVWDGVLATLSPAQAEAVRRDVSLVAIGGFGRREMAPSSDVDLMLLHDGADRAAVTDVARQLMQDLFDAGLQVGHSVRSVGEACRLAGSDATIMTSLFDLRTLAGRPELAAALAARLRSLLRRSPRAHAARLVAARREEADKFGQTVALLEPNVKRSPGGLRDIQLIRWLALVLHEAESLDDLQLTGGMPRRDVEALKTAADFLMRVRNDLHLAAGKAADDLTRDQQLRIAQARGIESTAGLLGVERFMRDYFGHTRRVAQILEGLEQNGMQRGLVGRMTAGVLGHRVDGLYVVGPRTVAAVSGCGDRVAGSLAAIVRLVELALLYRMPIDPATWEAVRVSVPSLPREADAAAKEVFLRLFTQADGLADALRRLHEAGALEILIPQFAHARHLLQFNNYHKYTVDEHCILSVQRATEFARDDGWLGRAWAELPRRRPLLLALLIHDLGKGFVEDHSEVGARFARDIAIRFDLPADEAEIIEYLVLKHLSMAHLAFRRNTGDDSIVVAFARDVGSPEVLRLLALLTAADVSAVGPGTWTKWKADILGELSYRTLGYLDGDSPSVAADRTRKAVAAALADRPADDPVLALSRRLPASYLRDASVERIVEELGRLARLPADGVFAFARWQPDTSTVRVTVGTREGVAPGVFHRVTGALTSQRLEILAADINTLDDGLVIDHFVVHDPDFAGEPPAERLTEIAEAIRAALKADRAPEFTRRWNPFAPQTKPAAAQPPRVLVDNESSKQATILEVFATDAPGLLYAVAKAIYEAELSVKAARIGTYLDQVVDAFHVTDRAGRKVTDPSRLAAIRKGIEAVVTAAAS
ncbi:MAG: [protein-PII] uridylyltransferase [Pirellulales bacterium]